MAATAQHPALDPRAGIPEEYWEYIDQYRNELVQQALQVVKDREDAEDVVQETFGEAFRDAQKIPGVENIRNWLRMINHRNALSRLRTRKSKRMTVEKKEREQPGRTFTTGGFSLLELRDSVHKMMGVLPQNLQDVVRLRYWEHLSYKEISERRQITVGSVQRQLFEASKILHARLRAQYGSSLSIPVTPAQLGVQENAPTQQTAPVEKISRA